MTMMMMMTVRQTTSFQSIQAALYSCWSVLPLFTTQLKPLAQ